MYFLILDPFSMYKHVESDCQVMNYPKVGSYQIWHGSHTAMNLELCLACSHLHFG